MAQDKYQRARERWEDSVEASSEQRSRMVDDLNFSNPTDPQQWDEKVLKARNASADGDPRPSYVFDQTNQYIAQVVNDSRKNKPQIQTVPASSGADEDVSEALDGMIRQIEYASSASIAYDTAVEHAARIGMGWMGLIPVVVDPAYNEQEIRIRRFADPLAIKYDPNFISPDGSDQDWGFVETNISHAAYESQFKKKARSSWESVNDKEWGNDKTIRVAEYFYKSKTKGNELLVTDPDDPLGAGRVSMDEQKYWDIAKSTGVKLEYHGTFSVEKTKVMWCKMDGDDILSEKEFPSKWIPLFPTLGYELWIEGKRYLCGMVRRMRAGQTAYNLERNSALEWMTKQPKAPYIMPWQAVANFQDEWADANTSNRVYLPYDHLDADGNPIPQPQRLNPPDPGAAFASLGEAGISDMQASIGMYRANLGAPSNETSGLAIKRREQQGDTANFHYIDNQSRTMTHMGRVIVDMIPRIYDTKRAARILGIDGKSQQIVINPGLGEPLRKEGKKVVEINLSTGQYDVRCKVGPAYASLREETAESLTRIVSQSPQLFTVLGPMWARMQDWPEAEHLSKLLLAMAPPPVQAIESEAEEISPKALMQINQLQQQVKQLTDQGKQLAGALTNAAEQHAKAEQMIHNHDNQAAAKQNANLVDKYKAESDRLKDLLPFLPPEVAQAMVMQLAESMLQGSPLDNTVPMPTQVSSMPAQAPTNALPPPMQGGPPGPPQQMNQPA